MMVFHFSGISTRDFLNHGPTILLTCRYSRIDITHRFTTIFISDEKQVVGIQRRVVKKTSYLPWTSVFYVESFMLRWRAAHDCIVGDILVLYQITGIPTQLSVRLFKSAAEIATSKIQTSFTVVYNRSMAFFGVTGG